MPGFGSRARRRLPFGNAVAAVPGASRTSFAATGLTPALHYHPNSESVTVASGRLTGVAANAWGPALTASATGPLEQTDARGLKRWRGEGSHYLDVPNSFAANPRGVTIFIVGRIHAPTATNNLFSISYQSDGVTALAGGATFRCLGTGGLAPWLYNSSRASSGSTTNKEFLSPGTQLQVMGLASRTTVNGGSKFWLNAKPSSTIAESGVTGTGSVGARIGGYVSSNGTTNVWDIYEIAVFTGELTDVQAQAVADALVANWQIPAITQNVILEGDSITAGITEITSGVNLGMVLTEPTASLYPANVRVINRAVSGAAVADLITRRDVANGWPALKIGNSAADNLLACQIGRNDFSNYRTANPGWTNQQVADAIYADILTYHNTPSTGVVARGWTPVQFRNIQNGSNDNNEIELLADKIGAQFATDVSGGAARNLRSITFGGVSIFDYPFQAAWYQNGGLDTTHPNILGTAAMASGGQTPGNGYGSLF